MAEICRVVTIPGAEESIAGAMMMQSLWQGGEADVLAVLETMPVDGFINTAPPVLAILCRLGRPDDARSYLERNRAFVDQALAVDTWYSPMAWSMIAETASHLGDRELAAQTYERLIDLTGQFACAGTGSAIGPVDMFLAMAAHTVGDDDLASRHAQRAVEQCEQWDVPLAAEWALRQRERFGF